MSSIGNANYLNHNDIRMYLRDHDPSANLLLDDYEYTSDEINAALTYTVDYFNETPPNTGTYDYDKFPWRFALLQGTSAQLLFMAAHRFRRNALQYNAGGLQVADQAKFQEYEASAARMWGDYRNWVAQSKVSMNIDRGWASI